MADQAVQTMLAPTSWQRQEKPISFLCFYFSDECLENTDFKVALLSQIFYQTDQIDGISKIESPISCPTEKMRKIKEEYFQKGEPPACNIILNVFFFVPNILVIT